MENEKFPQGSIVKLKNGPDAVYPRAPVGSEAIVLRTHMKDNFEMIDIKWRREDWRYGGQDDGWTYADHFELKSLPKVYEPTVDKEIVLSHKLEPEIENYIAELEKAFVEASGSEGFLIISVERLEQKKGTVTFLPSIRSAFHSLEARGAVEAILAEVLAQSHRDIIGYLLQTEGK